MIGNREGESREAAGIFEEQWVKAFLNFLRKHKTISKKLKTTKQGKLPNK